MRNFFWVVGEKKKRMPVINGYLFYFKKSSLNATKWRCAISSCSVTALVTSDDIYSLSKDHHHSPNERNIYKLQVIQEIRILLEEDPFISGGILYNKAIQKILALYNFDASISGRLPSFSSLMTSIYRYK